MERFQRGRTGLFGASRVTPDNPYEHLARRYFIAMASVR